MSSNTTPLTTAIDTLIGESIATISDLHFLDASHLQLTHEQRAALATAIGEAISELVVEFAEDNDLI